MRHKIFLSYSRRDRAEAMALETALVAHKLSVFRDERGIGAGDRFTDTIETALRRAKCAVFLLTRNSVKSVWVSYEYGFAVGAGTRGVAVAQRGADIPLPLQRFQQIRLGSPMVVAAAVAAAARLPNQVTTAATPLPKLLARFQTTNGEPMRAPSKRPPAYWLDVWIEGAPANTKAVSYEIFDLGFKDRKWTVKRARTHASRQFITDDMSSWGDVDLSARGIVTRGEPWTITTTLYGALRAYYGRRKDIHKVKRALEQIRSL